MIHVPDSKMSVDQNPYKDILAEGEKVRAWGIRYNRFIGWELTYGYGSYICRKDGSVQFYFSREEDRMVVTGEDYFFISKTIAETFLIKLLEHDKKECENKIQKIEAELLRIEQDIKRRTENNLE